MKLKREYRNINETFDELVKRLEFMNRTEQEGEKVKIDKIFLRYFKGI